MFQFRLATLMKLREAARDVRRRDLAEAIRAADVLRAEIESLVLQRGTAAEQSRAAAQPGAVDVDRLVAEDRFRLLLDAHRRRLEEQSARLSAEIERRRGQLALADREVQVLVRLRERQLTAFQQAEVRKETREMDEIGTRSAIRRIKE